ncbi:cephalosporin C regulator [Fusarium heterosporum]|uniref:Cephalosporin C regulator n=1 Tax=Fusarium heterosporum TaxID=42747 RepID=A0A8H5SQL0_FUSHE|nr:cephalosporin C regulator [Fusarium heterosporum]
MEQRSQVDISGSGQAPPPATRASARSNRRPLSQASTASLNSLEHSGFADTSEMFQSQWLTSEQAVQAQAHAHAQAQAHGHGHGHGHNHSHGHIKEMGGGPMSTEELMLQVPHLQGQQDYTMDASMSAPMGHPMQYQQKHPMQRHPLPAEQYNNSFTEPDSQMMERDDNDEGDSIVNMPGPSKPASTRSSANNELEMRQLFGINRHRSLQEVAGELHGNERGPNSERTRQVFAMLWINSVCTKGKGSVPRGRVYANYASRCANERITVLNPASFGKLVRVLFPGLKTRRLGVRGESKYHYVNFTLIEDEPEAREPSAQPARSMSEATCFTQSFNTLPSQPSVNLSQGALPSPHIGSEVKAAAPPRHADSRSHSLYNQPDVPSIDHLNSTTTKTQIELAFPPEHTDPIDLQEALPLPSIEQFLPEGTDPDAAKSLSALYRSHCTSLVECIRFCKEKTFFHLYTSFQGTLTMPVQKLFSNQALAPWIEECDFVLYQRMMSIVFTLTLQVVPKSVLNTFREISQRLVLHIRESFQGQPPHVLRAKEGPATLFSGLLNRALRVNLTAHAAANMLSNSANRDQMYLDWITTVKTRKLAECVPTRAMDDVVDLVLNEIRTLLDPSKVPWEVECVTLYGDVVSRSGRSLDADEDGDASDSRQGVLDRWVAFLRSLPGRFPYASPVDIMWCVERIGTAVMRDITVSGGESFGSWWVTKTWVDEMICFLVEQGGFMKQKRSRTTGTTTSVPPQAAKEKSRQNSRYSSGSDELNMNNTSQNQGERAPFPPANKVNQNSMGISGGDIHDDSGIGIRTPEDEFPMEKFGFPGAENHELLTGPDFATDGL